MATVYAVASAKGGVGKTTTTAAIATILTDSGANVVAIDADIGMANLAGALGVTPGETTLHDVLAGRADPTDAVHDGPAGLRVVPGATDLDAYATADPSGLKAVIAAFDDADYVFIDAGAGLSHDSTLPLGLADETLLVSTPERSALGDTEKTRQLTERLGGSVAGAAITRVDDNSGNDTETIDTVTELLDTVVLGRIPEDEAVLQAAAAEAPLPIFAPDSRATRAYRDLTRALTDAEISGEGLSAGETVAATADEEREEEPEEGADEPSESDETAESDGDEDIIVADSEQAGLGAPKDEDEIIVADESPVTEADGDQETRGATEVDETVDTEDGGAESETTTANTVDDETEMVGEEHVNGDDLEAMIDDDLDETVAFDDDGSAETTTVDDERADQEPTGADETGAIADADEVASKASESEVETADTRASDGDSGPENDVDDELAGSVPFRDDDTGTMKTTLSADEDDETDDAEADDAGTDDVETEDAGTDDDEKRGGFFSRLLGR